MGAHFSHPKVSRIFGRAKKNPKDPNIATSHGSLGTQKGSVWKGNGTPAISGKSRLVKYCNLARNML